MLPIWIHSKKHIPIWSFRYELLAIGAQSKGKIQPLPLLMLYKLQELITKILILKNLINVMKKISLFLALMFSSCHDTIKYDFELSGGKIIGKYDCTEGSDEEYWLINFVPTNVSSKIYGKKMIINDKLFENIVTTNLDLSEKFEDSTKLYLFSFYINSAEYKFCEFSTDSSQDVPVIDIVSYIPASQ